MKKIIIQTKRPNVQPEFILPGTVYAALLDWFSDEENGTVKARTLAPYILQIISAEHQAGRITESELSSAVIQALLEHADVQDADVTIIHAERRDTLRGRT